LKKLDTSKLGLSKLWEVLLVIVLIAFGYTFTLYLFDRFTIFTHDYTFPRFVIIIVLAFIFYSPFYNNKAIVRFKYFGSICFVYLLTVSSTTLAIAYFDESLKSEYIAYQIHNSIEQDQKYLASKNRTLYVKKSYSVIEEAANNKVSIKNLITEFLISLITGLLFSYLVAYFFTFKSFKHFNSSSSYN